MINFDPFPDLYLLVLYSACWVILWMTGQNKLQSTTLFLSAVGLLFVLLRLPSLVFDQEINPDESQMIAQALALKGDPVYFRSVDGTTGGPLDSYLLLLPTALGLPFDYITARITACCLLLLTFGFSFYAARRLAGNKAAQLALLPALFTLGLTRKGDFLSYNSELLAMVLLSVMVYCYITILQTRQPTTFPILVIGLLAGTIPFCKLQAVPVAATITLFTGLYGLVGPNRTQRDKRRSTLVLLLSTLVVPGIAMLVAYWYHVQADLLTFYILGNLNYAGGTSFFTALLKSPSFIRGSAQFLWLLLLLLATALTAGKQLWQGRQRWFVQGFLALMTLVSVYVIIMPGTGYPHYLLFLINLSVIWFAMSWRAASEKRKLGIPAGSLLFFLLAFGLQLSYDRLTHTLLNPYPTHQQGGWQVAQTPLTRAIQHYAHPGEKLVVWGWRNDYYVRTQMPQGVAENHVILSVFNRSMRPLYHQRYIRDFQRSTPPVFVDATGPQNLWMTDPATQGHEINAALCNYVSQHYTLVDTIDDSRLYVRNDRIKAMAQRNKSVYLSSID